MSQIVNGYSHISDIGELQQMLADERARSEQHRQNYQALKNDHSKLQEENIELQNEIRSTLEETKLVQEKYKHLYEQARKEVLQKQQEIEELHKQILSPSKLELVKTQIADEVEGPLRDKLRSVLDEVDQYRSQYNKLKYEHTFLLAELDRAQSEHKNIVQELKTMHEAEVVNIRKEREALASRLQTESQYDSQRLRAIQRENNQLQLKLKSVLAELEDVRAQREHGSINTESANRQHSRQIVEQAAAIKALETERQSLRQQVESLQKELTSQSDQHNRLLTKLHDLEKDNVTLKTRVDEVQHRCKVELTEAKMASLEEKGELERQRDQLTNQIEDLKAHLEVIQLTQNRHEQKLADKERDAQRRIQSAREEGWRKVAALENEKIELETRLQEMERRKSDEGVRLQADREKAEERLQQARDAKESAEREVLVLKTKISHQESLANSLQRLEQENIELKGRLHRLEATYSSYMSCEQDLTDTVEKTQRNADKAREEADSLKQKLDRVTVEMQQAQQQNKSAWLEERDQLQKRVAELEGQVVEAREALGSTVDLENRRKKKISQVVSKLKGKLKLQAAKIEELKLEKETLRRFVSPEKHVEIKKRLNDLIRRHQQFGKILLSGDAGLAADVGSGSWAPTGSSRAERWPGLHNKGIGCVHSAQAALGCMDSSYSGGSYIDLPTGSLGKLDTETLEFLDLASQDVMNLKQRLDQLQSTQQEQYAQLTTTPRNVSKDWVAERDNSQGTSV